jgi:hypothetical protein
MSEGKKKKGGTGPEQNMEDDDSLFKV